MSYTLVAGVVLLAMYLVYGLALAAENQPRFNRAVLLSCYATAAIVPFLWWHIDISQGDVLSAVTVGTPSATVEEATREAARAAVWPRILTAIYLAGVAVVFFDSVVAWVRLRRIILRARTMPCGRYTLAITDDPGIAPFSWNCYIVMNRKDYDENGQVIIVHETAHLDRGHRFDLIVARLFEMVVWYNPASWLMTRSLRTVHEYEADRLVVESVDNARDYQLFLIKKAVGRSFPAFANSLNHSNLKKRITMMLKSQSSKRRRVRALALVPAVAVALLSVNIPFVARAIDAVSSVALASDGSTGGKVIENSANVQQQPQDKAAGVTASPEKLPQYPGGDAALMQFLMENMRYPESEIKNGGAHTVIVQFTIDADGSVSNPVVRKSAGEAFDAEALRVVGQLPKFIPGTVDGKPVAVSYVLPFMFKAK